MRLLSDFAPKSQASRTHDGVKLDQLSALADEHGLLHKQKLVPNLLSASSWSRAVRFGQLVTIQPGVAIVRTTARTPVQRVAASVIAAGDDALAGGPTAAWLYGSSIPLLDPVHVVTPTRPRHKSLVGTMLHRPLAIENLDVEVQKGIPVTGPFRTLLDCCAWAPVFSSSVLEHFLVDGRLTVSNTWRQLFAHARQGRPGVSALRLLLQKWSIDSEQPESVLEAKMLSLCFTNSLPSFEFQAQIGPYRVDFLWRDQQIIAECDGFAFHGSTRDQFERDRERDAYLQSLGFTVWRFSFRQITTDPAGVGRLLRTAFRREFA